MLMTKTLKHLSKLLLITLVSISIAGCFGKSKPAKISKARGKVYRTQKTYIVKSGDNLYFIAKKLGVSTKDLTKRNKLRNNAKIFPGQRIKYMHYHKHPQKTYSGKTSTRQKKYTSIASSNHKKTEASKKSVIAKPIASNFKWGWPAKGKIINNYYQPNSKLRGINIASFEGAPVKAAATGTVVYSGNALRGYGNLIIIKHNNIYLTAYAHNSKILVREGQKVSKGQLIAKMGKSGAKKVMLHFEVRRYGKPIDPMRVLPKKS